MKETITIDASGRLVVPKWVRRQLNLSGGDRLQAAVVGGRIELTPVGGAKEPTLARKAGIMVLGRTGASVDAAAAVAAEREALAGRARPK